MDAQKKLFDLHDLIPGGKTNKQFAPVNLKNSSWAGDTFVSQNGDTLISVTGEGKKDNKIVITLEEINKSLQANDIETLEKFPAIKVPEKKNPGFCYFINGNNLILFSLKDKTITQIFKFEDGDNGQDINPNFNHVAVCNGNNLFVVDKTG